MQKTPYSSKFHRSRAEGSANAAAIIVPIVLSFLPAESVIDVGCSIGAWAAAFRANGVPDVLGVDGDYVDRSQLQIPSDLFVAHDLAEPLHFDRIFDLAVCLEVAEHLPESRASGLVADLISLAPCVLFSAAVPGQGGTNHLNEQYLPYWVALFQTHGYEGTDLVRPLILGNHLVDWWYQQNIVIFAARNHRLLAKGFSRPQTFIHQELYDRTRNHPPSLGTLVRAFPGAIYRSICWRLGALLNAEDYKQTE